MAAAGSGKKSASAADSYEVDLVNRDPSHLNDHIKSKFDDILGETREAHSIDCVWINSHKCFSCGFNCLYKTLSVLTGLCAALYWGCSFAMLTYCHVWCLTPHLKHCVIHMHLVKRFKLLMLDTFCGPIMETIALVFSKIKVQTVQK